jgi:uncharacterized protein (DUF58 family)
MDWNVTARTQLPHVRETIADRELETWVLVDVSASMRFGTAACEKRDLALAAVAALGFLTARTGNRIGAVIVGGDRPVVVPAKSGRQHLMALLHTVTNEARSENEAPADLGMGLHRLGALMRRRGLAVVVSDFLDDGAWERPLRALSARHETLAVEVVDPREIELPDIGVVELIDPETGKRFEVQTANAGLRQRFADAAQQQRDGIARRLRSATTDHLVLRTDRDWLLELARFVALRRDRVEALTRSRR